MTLVTNTLTISDATPKVQGFGTILIYAYLTAFSGVREYSADSDGLAGLVADGVSVDSDAYALASVICSQTPHVSKFKVAPAIVQTESFTLEILEVVVGATYSVWVKVGSATAVLSSYVAVQGDTLTTIATALAGKIDDDLGLSVNHDTATISVSSAVANKPIHVRGFTRNIKHTRVGTSAGITEDLGSVNTLDSDWYGLLIGWTSAGAIETAVAWAEANGKRCFNITADTDCMTLNKPTCVAAVLKSSAFSRNAIVITRDEGGRLDAAAAGYWFAKAPPKVVTLHAKSVTGPIVDALTPTEISAIRSYNGIAYFEESGIPMLHDGWASSGRFLDNTLLADWVVARINESIVQMEATNDNIPFDRTGEGLVEDAISKVFGIAEDAGVIAKRGDKDGGWLVTVQDTSKVSATDRGQRRYPGTTYKFRVLGSMHYLDVTGTMGV